MKITLPRILIIDDIFGSSFTDRRNFCRNFFLADVRGDDNKPASIQEPVAEAVFCSGQIKENNKVKNDVEGCINTIRKGWVENRENRWALMLLDLRFTSGEIGIDDEPEGQPGDETFGLVILEAAHKEFPDLPIVIISSRERKEVIEDCRTKGAADFIQRHGNETSTLTPKEILRSKIIEHGLIEDNRTLSSEKYRIIGKSLALLKTLRTARRAATGKGNILLLGETGTGKELLARYIHDVSPKSKGPYKIFHPFGTAETLQEDELFGHIKGTFTGATSNKEGFFEIANGGTLFIDEIGDVPESLQLKLLRPLENRVVTKQGSNNEIPIDIQVVLATNKNLEEFSKTGRFKFDLLNRINAYTITIPPLRDRKDDIPLIAERLLEILCKENRARWPRKILSETIDILKNHDWRDNIRGLRNVLERAVKDNRDSELLIPSDIRFDMYVEPAKAQVIKPIPKGSNGNIDTIIDFISNVEFPEVYSKLQGKLPELQKAVARMFAKYLESSIEVTKKMKPGSNSEGEINLTGAASCMMGTQLKTPKAADLIKRLLQQDKVLLENFLKEYPILDKAYKEALRLRPKKPVK